MHTLLAPKYREICNNLPQETARRILALLDLTPIGEYWTFADELERHHLGHADTVLALLHKGAVDLVSLLTRYTHCPPTLALLRRPLPLPAAAPRTGDEILVTGRRSGTLLRIFAQMQKTGLAAAHSPRLSATGRKCILADSPMYDRLNRIKPGMSVQQMLGRGLRRRDILIAQRRGWLVLEQALTA